MDAVGALYNESKTVETSLGLNMISTSTGNAKLRFEDGKLLGAAWISFPLDPAVVKTCDKQLKDLREVWFAAAFVGIGLETKLGDLAKLGGGRPALAFVGGQAANVLWTLLSAWRLFGRQ